MYKINEDVIFVQGAKNGAIYDFNSGKVYWINEDSCKLLYKLISSYNGSFSDEEQFYINKLIQENLYSKEFTICEYKPQICDSISLEMAWLEITQACNCKCLHCYQGEVHKTTNNTLNINRWKEIILELKKINIKRLVVIGGEPCLHKDINEIIQFLCENKLQTTLFTNGTSFTEELKNIIVKNKEYVKIKVSLYGYNSDTHDLITQVKGSFTKLEETIKYFQSNGVTVDIAVIAMKENQDILENIKQYIENLNIKYNGYDVIRNVYGGTQNKHTPDNDDVLSMSIFTKPTFYASKERFESNYQKNSCWFGKIAITENGDVLPCVFERNIKYGNIKNQSLSDILSSKSLTDMWFLDFSKIDYCKDCEFRFACKDCRPLGISVSGKITEKNPRCTYNPYTGEWGIKYERK